MNAHSSIHPKKDTALRNRATPPLPTPSTITSPSASTSTRRGTPYSVCLSAISLERLASQLIALGHSLLFPASIYSLFSSSLSGRGRRRRRRRRRRRPRCAIDISGLIIETNPYSADRPSTGKPETGSGRRHPQAPGGASATDVYMLSTSTGSL